MRCLFLTTALLSQLGCGTYSIADGTAVAATSPLAAVPPPPLHYPWLTDAPTTNRLAQRFAPPPGCRRVAVAPGSWGEWLRWLPLRPAGTSARLFNGELKSPQEVVAAVVNIDPGTQDLQQCADAVIRLRAEYLFAAHQADSIHFRLTNGYDFRFVDFVAGRSFRVVNEKVLPAVRPAETASHAALGRYLLPTFGYAGTLSLSRELRPVPLAEAQPGDVLIHGGSPGHAVLVLDVAVQPATGQRYLLLAQSYMPAQDIHVLQNIYAEGPALRNHAWFAVPRPEADSFDTPEWSFETSELARF
jgi:Domain of unknown function (4846)